MTRPPLLIAAAETSAERLALAVASELTARGVPLRALGGPVLRDAGVPIAADASQVGVMGPLAALATAPRALGLWAAARLELAAGPAACLTVDAPTLWLPVAREARRRGVPALHLAAPQVWAWRPGRAARVGRSVDLLLCLLPFEPAWFRGHVRAVFVGHPAAAVVGRPQPRAGTPTIALCPGSRRGEVSGAWPRFAEVARHVRRQRPEASFLVPVAPGVDVPLHEVPGARRVDGIEACAGADAALVVSGTATLELAALDVPMVVTFPVHPIAWEVGRRLLSTPFVALPNVIAGRELAPERVGDPDPADLAADLLGLVGQRGQVPRELITSLGGDRAVERIVEQIAPYVVPFR